MRKTEIKAVEMVREIRDALHEETKDLGPEDLLAFIKKQAADFRASEERRAESARVGSAA